MAQVTQPKESVTPEEHQHLQMNARAAARETALTIFVRELSKAQLHPELLRSCIAQLRQAGIGHTIPGPSPDYSMLLAGETQEAYEALADLLEKQLVKS